MESLGGNQLTHVHLEGWPLPSCACVIDGVFLTHSVCDTYMCQKQVKNIGFLMKYCEKHQRSLFCINKVGRDTS